jgi:hypothetical protein
LNVPYPELGQTVPYLAADSERIAAWQMRLRRDDRLNVGLAWEGAETRSLRPNRPAGAKTLPLVALEPLAGVAGARFFSLQKFAGELRAWQDLTPVPIADAARDCADFRDLAALVATMDVVVTADTAVAHLSGAMGKPTLLMLPFVADWKWEVARSDSPWYPTVSLYRQSSPVTWRDVVQDVVRELQRLVAAHPVAGAAALSASAAGLRS